MSYIHKCQKNIYEQDNDAKNTIDDVKNPNESKKIKQLSEIVTFLRCYDTFIDVILHRINIMHNDGYKLNVESINQSLFRLQCLRATSISYTTNTLNFDLNLDKKDQINFSLDWTKSVTDNVSIFLVQIYVIKKDLRNEILS